MKTVVISGGTATNNIIEAFIPRNHTDRVDFILPISDNGGSSSEIRRVFGGCAIGDIRSRIVRLIPDDGLRSFLSYRLRGDAKDAKDDWNCIINKRHANWGLIDYEAELKGIILKFLEIADVAIKGTTFSFQHASVGNLFLLGARMFFNDSLETAVEFALRICRVDDNIGVQGCIAGGGEYDIAAVLENGAEIVGQSEVSHPGQDGNQLVFARETEDLPARIVRMKYVRGGDEIFPRAGAGTLRAIGGADVVVVSVGSLWTSIVPVLLAAGVREAVRGKKVVMLVNGERDRETSGMTVADQVEVVESLVGPVDAVVCGWGERWGERFLGGKPALGGEPVLGGKPALVRLQACPYQGAQMRETLEGFFQSWQATAAAIKGGRSAPDAEHTLGVVLSATQKHNTASTASQGG